MGRMYAKTPVIFQMEATECGAASLAMIFAFWGKHLPLEQMRIETGVSRDGCNAGNIMRAAKRFGMECHGYRKEPESLKKLELPCIIHWNFNHFVVLEGFKGKYAYINDPALGRRRLTMQELDECFTGIVLTFRPTDGFVKEKKKRSLLPLIQSRISGVRSELVQIILIGLMLVVPGLAIPILSQVFLDQILGKSGVPWFVGFVLFMISAVLFRAALALLRSYLLRRVQNRLVLVSTKEFVRRLFRLPVNFYDQRYVGDIASRVSNNENINSFITGDLAATVLNIFVSIFYLFVLLCYDPLMTAIGLAGLAVNIIVVRVSSGVISNIAIKLQQDKGKLSGAVCAGLSITSTLKASGAESEYCSRILGYDAKACTGEQYMNKVQTIVDAIPNVVGNIVDVLLLVVGALLVVDGKMTLGMLLAFTSLFDSFAQPVEQLVSFVKKIQTLKADMERVDDIMGYPLDERFVLGIEKEDISAKLSGEVNCSDISFGYSHLGDPLVEELSFSIRPGGSVAFVGASGCGKSTVTKLVSGLYRPWTGMISFDGIPMDNIPPEVLNASVSIVSQNITLFSGSIRDNLTLWNPAISEADMLNAAKDACIHDVIVQKPGAYEYRLSEGGANLSGGQRQRLEIARALVTNPTVLIMDEATSALDPIVEKQIVDNIKRRGCTCIIVAHRLSAVRDCDRILVMSEGHVVEQGTHDELLIQDGHYAKLMNS